MANYRPGANGNIANQAVAAAPADGYTVLDLYGSWNITPQWRLSAGIYNLTDKFYLARVNNAGNRFMLGAPRSAMLTANIKF